MKKQVFELDPNSYARHLIHTQDRSWAETNCYVDVWIELLHAWGFDPIAALPFTLAIDFEGDQWTFFKYPLADLYELYALDVQELALWRPLVTHLEEQVELGRPVLVELDSYYLPDTAGTAYRHEHVKSTVAVIEIDATRQRLGYFHGQGYYHLHGDDFVDVFRLSGAANPSILPPYAEFVKRRTAAAPRGEALLQASLRILQRQLQLLPETNPFEKFKPRFDTDLQWLDGEPLETFHQYSFATLRQFGACYELAATYLGWLQAQHVAGLEVPIAAFTDLSSGAKTVQFHLARAMIRKKPLDLSALDTMAARWQTAVDHLNSADFWNSLTYEPAGAAR
jgi:hypothetical protein